MKNIFHFLFYVDKKLKILAQNVLTRTKFLSSLIKNFKYFNQEKS